MVPGPRWQQNDILIHPWCFHLFLNERTKDTSTAISPWTGLNLPSISQSRWLTVEEIPLKLNEWACAAVCPGSKCQCSADWMHVDRDNCGAAGCQGRGRAAQWPRLVTHLQHCRPTGHNNNPLQTWIRFCYSLLTLNHLETCLPMRNRFSFIIVVNCYVQLLNISGSCCGTMANPSHSVLREESFSTQDELCAPVRDPDLNCVEYHRQRWVLPHKTHADVTLSLETTVLLLFFVYK